MFNSNKSKIYKIAVLPGDGIGPEIMAEAIKVLKAIESKRGLTFSYHYGLVGGEAWDKYQNHFPEVTAKICEESDAILFGSVGGPINQQDTSKWRDCEKNSILAIRQSLGLTFNLRPVINLLDRKKNIDLICLRELSEDVYFGKHETLVINGEKFARDEMFYNESTIQAIAEKAFQIAIERRKKVISVDKANVLDCSKLWREVVTKVSQRYPGCELQHMLVDNCAMQLIKNPEVFDVVLMPNLFGDILSDLASLLGGSIGMLPSASFNHQGFGLYEPAGGSAPDIAGLNKANPIGQILSAGLMLKHSFGMTHEYHMIIDAIEKTLAQGYLTPDICRGLDSCSTAAMGNAIVKCLYEGDHTEIYG